jgi:hypothetical protein
MARKCFISCKTEDFEYKKKIQNDLQIDMIDKSLNDAIDSNEEDYILKKIRDEYLSDSTVTIHLIGPYSSEELGAQQIYIKRELQASLYHGKGNTQNGILGIVLPSMEATIYRGGYQCNICGSSHNSVIVEGNTLKEFSYNYYIPHDKCSWSEDDRFCVLVKWSEFVQDPEVYIEKAFEKRFHPIALKTKVRP